jgi:hypothetical protein
MSTTSTNLLYRLGRFQGAEVSWSDHYRPTGPHAAARSIELLPSRPMSLVLYPSFIPTSICKGLSKELLEDRAAHWRQYSGKGGPETRAHIAIHERGHLPAVGSILPSAVEKPGLPAYQHGNNVLLPLALGFFPFLQGRVLNRIDSEFAILKTARNDEFYWNCCINAVLFRSSKDHIVPHSDNTQGETQIVTLVAECEHMRVIRFTPKDEYYGDAKFPEFELYLRTGDVYAMDGALQQVYTHSVEASSKVEDLEHRRLAVVYCIKKQFIIFFRTD